MKNFLLLLAIGIWAFQGYAQDIYLPFLKNGHYGVVTSDGKTIVEAQYDEVIVGDVFADAVWEVYLRDACLCDYMIKTASPPPTLLYTAQRSCVV